MLKIHVKLLSQALMVTLRDMEVGMIYKGRKGLPKLVVHKTSRSLLVRNIGEEKTMTVSLFPKPTPKRRRVGVKPMKVFALAQNNQRDIRKLVNTSDKV